MRDWRIGRLGCNVTERAIEKHDLMRSWSTGRLGCNVTDAGSTAVSATFSSNKDAEISCTMELLRCSTCSEAFPGLHLHPGSSECVRCGRDKRTPKLYSTGNNMDPGPIPTVEDFNLWVNVLQLVTIIIICYLFSLVPRLPSHARKRLFRAWEGSLGTRLLFIMLVVLQHLYLALLLSVHTHNAYNAVFLDVETLHDIALFKIWLTPFAGI